MVYNSKKCHFSVGRSLVPKKYKHLPRLNRQRFYAILRKVGLCLRKNKGLFIEQRTLVSLLSATSARQGQPPDTWECERVTGVPSRVRDGYRLSSFYRKYLHAYGIPIISSGRVRDEALRRACYVVVFLFADRQDIRTWFYRRRGRAGVIAQSEGVTSIPEHAWLGSWWNQRARGLGATLTHPISTGK